MQTILGAGGDIGRLLAKELKKYTSKIRLVSRQPTTVNADDVLIAADLQDADSVDRAVQGSTIVYLTVGLPYDLRVWETAWPTIMQHVVDACIKHNCKLVFFDNVYMYDERAIAHMTEESPINPPSKKGRVRTKNLDILQNAMQNRGLKALIARSADFYGPASRNGILNSLVLTNIAAGKTANWQADLDKIHSFTYTPDAARATALLGNTDSAYDQVWHLPTSAERWTGREFIAYATKIKQVKNKAFVLRPFLLVLAGLFNRTIKELVEMQYQNKADYFFDSSKFNKTFDFEPTSYADGIKSVLQASTKSE
ncbi:NAD-dependent epimerase/dehydratase family protein [Sphingobacterium oryzagri]|uniref:NAD-dependent epimerase/dehydratase family protein n=1 Tax=Sphingobacterium oryzagri TaxID=3025669 RepID=A0ABY7WJ69_9SPHI|nr:NAD-dependent epimerase/dehydratase family protein [Sphingobacterium sp. KACC 22765]WDF67424.1 NAD-dependent epimerase/dehydratase family protein [Sphingobacterium sp. KACC 22765]